MMEYADPHRVLAETTSTPRYHSDPGDEAPQPLEVPSCNHAARFPRSQEVNGRILMHCADCGSLWIEGECSIADAATAFTPDQIEGLKFTYWRLQNEIEARRG